MSFQKSHTFLGHDGMPRTIVLGDADTPVCMYRCGGGKASSIVHMLPRPLDIVMSTKQVSL